MDYILIRIIHLWYKKPIKKMNDNILIEEQIILIKKRLIDKYVYLMASVLLFYSLLFFFLIDDRLLAYCIFGYFCILIYTWLLVRKRYDIKAIIHMYLIIKSLFVIFIMLYFCKFSFVTGIWLLPTLLIAYVFLERKYIYLYTLYIITIICIIFFLINTYTFNFFHVKNTYLLKISDFFTIISNIFIFYLILHYNSHIKCLMTKQNLAIEKIPNNSDSDENISSENIEKYVSLFEDIKKVVIEEMAFKDVDYNISKLAATLNINSTYASKAIKMNGYENFNRFLNISRINYIKKLFEESNLSKVTLMYLYTASGFSNQSTFNRVFKQIEGITPTEYIQKLKFNKPNVDAELKD